MDSSALGLLVSYGTQTLVALVLAAIFGHFYRGGRRAYLADFALAFVALCAYLVTAAGAARLAIMGSGLGERLLWSWASQCAFYAHIGLLLRGAFGVYAADTTPRLARGRIAAIGVVIGTAASLAWAFSPDGATERLVLRVGLRYALGSAAFLWAAVMIGRRLWRRGDTGPRLTALAFGFYGVLLAQSLGVFAWQMATRTRIPGVEYLGLLDLVALACIGFALIIWVADDEKRRADAASRERDALRKFDPSTGLANRPHVVELLAQDLEGIGASVDLVVHVVDVVDLDRVQRSAGNRAAERIAGLVAQRLDAYTVALAGRRLGRLDPRRFVVCHPWPDRDAGLAAFADGLIEALSGIEDAEGGEHALRARVGVAVARAGSHPAHDAESVLLQAERTLAAASARVVFHAPELDAALQRHQALAGETKAALANREFVPYFQPIVRADTHRVTGFELLARWRHRSRGVLLAGEFLPALAEQGLLVELDRQLLREGCAWMAQAAAGASEPLLSVNVSAHAFDADDFVAHVLRTLDACGLASHRLQLEITESIALANPGGARHKIRRLRDHGVRVALDDFGVGYSSLAQLRDLPVDAVKIDRGFTVAAARDARSSAIVQAMTSLARALGLEVVAEGVERRDEVERMEVLGASHLQGFYFGAAVPALEAGALLGRALPDQDPMIATRH